MAKNNKDVTIYFVIGIVMVVVGFSFLNSLPSYFISFIYFVAGATFLVLSIMKQHNRNINK